MFENILPLYGLNSDNTTVNLFGDGLINHTWKVTAPKQSYILQKVNTDVFKEPSNIDKNLCLLKDFLNKKDPKYLFVSPINAISGASLLKTPDGYFRMTPFVEGSISLNALTKREEAYEAAKQFGKFSALLADFNAEELNITIPDFHNLNLRYEQFKTACANANPKRMEQVKEYVEFINEHKSIVDTYLDLVANEEVPLRVIHHDTKINNVLFDAHNKGICVIDLDTVMPGYFISDVGDMMRTYLCAASEEENDLSKISIRKDFFKAIYEGYMEEMADVLTDTEKQYFSYAGKFIIYMQAIRFLADYLQNDIYYGAKYEGHNFNRAKNQITLLKEYLKMEEGLTTPPSSSKEPRNQPHAQ
ncbi:aminoglycoside phosphotransferase family protein [Pedobacter sp. N36a]|uniref:phosphotransferase enzyme family protein n=1 Tax=Pedobacter sp. N36a TaxID=2767996 RepID=UPI0016569500|nr:aminoglycoside phosphotransferase family protein [Pedobacter sp. N36a]MBC8985141.1 aminoglycoside phosphotransferase family protein [Pedobacter sp. N36a]